MKGEKGYEDGWRLRDVKRGVRRARSDLAARGLAPYPKGTPRGDEQAPRCIVANRALDKEEAGGHIARPAWGHTLVHHLPCVAHLGVAGVARSSRRGSACGGGWGGGGGERGCPPAAG